MHCVPTVGTPRWESQVTTLETYKARWEDFRIECANLRNARRWLLNGFGNEDVGADEDELWDRVWRFEDRIAHLSVADRADRLMSASYRYGDI